MKKRKMKLWKVILSIFLGVFLVAGASIGIYLGDFYHASKEAFDAMKEESREVTITEKKNNRIVFQPQDPVAGLIFYPGGKVEYEAYAPLMKELAENGILCVLVHMPGNLAVLDMNAAQGIREEYPMIENWYMAGHSLGGAMAASYVSKHVEEYK